MLESVTQITSKNNPLLKKIRQLMSGTHRFGKNLVLAEGTRVLEEVVRSDREIESVVISEDFGSGPREVSLLDSWNRRKVKLYRVNAALFRSLSSLNTDQCALALVKVPCIKLPKNLRSTIIIYAMGIQDPGNLGTLIRTAAASGSAMICTSTGTVSARNPKTIRSSAGVFFHHPPVEHVSYDTFLRFCREKSIRIFSTDMLRGTYYTEADLSSPCAVLLGNEGSGVLKGTYTEFPSLRIPMENGIESLNVAVAGAILLFEAARQRSLRIR